jgi:hypothetical protein
VNQFKNCQLQRDRLLTFDPLSWGAIVKGAVLSQMPHEAVVTATKCVRHYGVSANAVYKEAEDAGQEKIWDTLEGIYRVSKMTWYLNYVGHFGPI